LVLATEHENQFNFDQSFLSPGTDVMILKLFFADKIV
jgi:hypothetical protein